MSHYAQILNGVVTQVIVAEAEFIQSGAVGDPAAWIQTSYNTRRGLHHLGGTPLRRNYAGVGMIYDPVRDAFYWPQPQDGTTWVFDEFSCTWRRPVAAPDDGGVWLWDEAVQNWVAPV